MLAINHIELEAQRSDNNFFRISYSPKQITSYLPSYTLQEDLIRSGYMEIAQKSDQEIHEFLDVDRDSLYNTFAEACFLENTIDDLIEAQTHDDAADCRGWNMTTLERFRYIDLALRAMLFDSHFKIED